MSHKKQIISCYDNKSGNFYCRYEVFIDISEIRNEFHFSKDDEELFLCGAVCPILKENISFLSKYIDINFDFNNYAYFLEYETL